LGLANYKTIYKIQGMKKRLLRGLLARHLKQFPALTLVGPRQCGKTTLAKAMGGRYLDLEDPAQRLRLDLDWDAPVGGKELLVLDEAQEHPELFARLRGAIDRDRKRAGRFLMLGSVSPALMRHASESLAGRMGLLELTPFVAEELPARSLDALWFNGGFPDGGVLAPKHYGPWQQGYLAALTQRDLPTWGLPARPGVSLRLLKLLAASQGAIWNASQIGAAMGLSYNTVNAYTDFMDGAFLVRHLRPWHANLSKRLIKSPKIYVRDSGLLHSLLGLSGPSQLLDQPWVGASWEGFVIEQIINSLRARGLAFEAHYFRTSDGHELDLLLSSAKGLHAVEVKLTAQPRPADLERPRHAASLVKADTLTLVCRKDLGPVNGQPEAVLGLASAIQRLAGLL
jgi:hypothetical protein